MNPFKGQFQGKLVTPSSHKKSRIEQRTSQKGSSMTAEYERDLQNSSKKMNLLSENLRILSQKTKHKYQQEEEREKRSTRPRKAAPKSPRTPLYSQQELLLTIENLQRENEDLRIQNELKGKQFDELHLKYLKLKQKLSMDRVKKNSYGPITELRGQPRFFSDRYNNQERKSRNSNPARPKFYTSFHDDVAPRETPKRQKGRLGGVFQTLRHLKDEIKQLKEKKRSRGNDKNIDRLINELRVNRMKNEEMCQRLAKFTGRGQMDQFNSKINELFYGSVSQNVKLINEVKEEYEGLVDKMGELEQYCLKMSEENLKLKGNHFSRSTANFRFYEDE